ncbi:MAG: glycosyltransferase family 87 protein, partial [Chloroflexota bacterium]
ALPGLLKRVALIAPLAFLLAASLTALIGPAVSNHGPSNSDLGGDFAMFYTAAHVFQTHGDPYVPRVLLRSEVTLMHQQHMRMTLKRKRWSLIRVGNPEVFFWALGPFTHLPFRIAGWIWFVLMALASTISCVIAMRLAGWRVRAIPLVLLLLMPIVSFGPYYGNDVPLVFLGLMLGLLAAQRFPLASGAIMAVAWLKPSVALPLVMLIVLFHVKDRRSVLAGMVLASITLCSFSLLILGPGSFVEWMAGLSRYSRDIASQPEIATLSGMYAGRVSYTVRTILEGASLCVALALTGWWWLRNGGRQTSFARTGWLWFAWFLATPYAHGNDLVLLTVPILVMLGRDGRRILRFPVAPAVYLLFITEMGYPVRIGSECILLTAACCIIASRKWPEPAISPDSGPEQERASLAPVQPRLRPSL